jgi:hypothetical protein
MGASSCLSTISFIEELISSSPTDNILDGIASSSVLPDSDWEGLSGGESDGSRNFRRITPGIGRGVAHVVAADRAVAAAVCKLM